MNLQTQKQFFEVYEIWYKNWWSSTVIYTLGAVLLLVIVGWFIVRLRRPKTLNLEQMTLQNLHRLRSGTYSSEASLHEAYFRLTMIMKQYLSNHYNIKLHDKSDNQIVAELHGIMPQNMLSLLQEFFDRSFRIKFAYDAVSEMMFFQDLELLQTIVLQTSLVKDSTGNH
ncbi:hypothetical protein KBD08_04155 [Candidatus Babeliales bacterium]|nr:hypothetical protein [Candidatus Babeliales bacterium]